MQLFAKLCLFLLCFGFIFIMYFSGAMIAQDEITMLKTASKQP